ncbi:MAG TPA: hypothetical protein VGF86_04700 [Candidatus Tumulicola sp.]
MPTRQQIFTSFSQRAKAANNATPLPCHVHFLRKFNQSSCVVAYCALREEFNLLRSRAHCATRCIRDGGALHDATSSDKRCGGQCLQFTYDVRVLLDVCSEEPEMLLHSEKVAS